MAIIKDGLLKLFFGDKSLSISADTIFKAESLLLIQKKEPFISVLKLLGAKNIILTKQTHGISICALHTEKDLQDTFFSVLQEADIIVTSLPDICIGVVTADCVPLIIFDPNKKVLATVHAGWRGSVKKVAEHAVDYLKEKCGSNPEKLVAYFGPCVHVGSYEAPTEAVKLLSESCFKDRVLVQKENKIYLNLLLLNQLQLKASGLSEENIHVENSLCTLSDQRYWSFRRDKESALRQITAACFCG